MHIAAQPTSLRGDDDIRSPRDAERARAAAIPREYATLGARLITVEEPPGNLPAWRTEDAVSVSAVPVANCELVCTETYERVSSLTPLGEDIVFLGHSTENFLQNYPQNCSTST